jgi:FAD/FMN-containing dehydrogenase/Fe-S oxidoreductase
MNPDKFSLLARGLEGELHADPVYREVFASAACLYRIKPAAVVIPKTASDVSRVLEFCSTEKMPLTPRGAGSAVAGQSLGQGLVVNFTKYFNRILEIDPGKKLAVVEPGVIFADLNRALKKHGLFFPPDPSSGNYCTIGSMIADNSSGAHSLFYGPTQDYIEELEAVLADGSTAVLGLNKFELREEKSYWPRTLRKKLDNFFLEYQSSIDRDRPRVKNSSGYLLWVAMGQGGVNYARLLAGSEGTLAVVLKASLRLVDLPKYKSAGLVFFKDLESATSAVLKIRELKPQAIEIMDLNFINIVRDHYPGLRHLLDDHAQFMLLCEFDGGTTGSAQDKIRSANQMVVEKEKLGYKSIIAQDDKEQNLLWQVRQAASPILYRLGTGLVRFVEDIVIPPEKLPQGLAKIREIFSEFKTYAPVMGHAGEGNLHLNPSFNPASKDDQRRMQICADQVYKTVIALHGSISGEHGDGILRAPYVQAQFPNAFLAFKELKNIFDPQEILNPGKILAETGLIPVSNIKYWTPETVATGLQKTFADDKCADLIFRCHGCGLCRTYCPAITGFESELSLPRSKVSVARALAQGFLDEGELSGPEMKTILGACFSCQRCLNLCPTGVEVPRILEVIKNYQHETALLSPRQELLDRSGDLINLMGILPAAALSVSTSPLAKIALSVLGLNPGAASFFNAQDLDRIKAAQKINILQPGAQTSELKIIYFPGCLERWLEPEQFEQTRKILDKLDAQYQVLDGLCCGMPASSANRGLTLAAAQKFAARVLPLIENGWLLLCNCPSCISTFRHHYPVLLGEAGEKIAKASVSVYELKEKLGAAAGLSATEKTLVYHRACHMIGLGEPDPVLAFLRGVPGLSVSAVVEKCCGAAGSFELKKENIPASQKIASALKQELEKSGAPLVVSACGLCRRKIRALGFEAQSPLDIILESGDQ